MRRGGRGKLDCAQHISEQLVGRVATRRPSLATNRPCKNNLKRREEEGREEEDERKLSPSLFSPTQQQAS